MQKQYWQEKLKNGLRSISEIAPDHEYDFHDQGDDFHEIMVQNQTPPRRAAVLVPLVWRGDTLKVILTQRTENLSKHAGQIAFPGGTRDKTDKDLVHTALREAQEEIGLEPSLAEIIGASNNYFSRSNFLITPILAILDKEADFKANENEVAKIFELPFEFLIDPAQQKVHNRVFEGVTRYYRAIECEGYYIWGVTASLFHGIGNRLSL